MAKKSWFVASSKNITVQGKVIFGRICDISKILFPSTPPQSRLTWALAFQSVPHVAVEVVVASQEQAAALGESHRGDAADDVVVAVHHQLLVGAQVKQPAGGVVRACAKGVPVGEELSRDDSRVRLRFWNCQSINQSALDNWKETNWILQNNQLNQLEWVWHPCVCVCCDRH